MNINTTDKVQVGDSTTSTSTGTTWHCPYTQPKAEQGWECPRCGRINAPWVRQCDCSGSNWTITPDWTYRPYGQWKEITCDGTSIQTQLDSETYKIHPDSTIYQVGGSDYWNPHTKIYENIPTHVSNKIDPSSVTTAQNCTNQDNCHTPHYNTETVVNNCIHDYYNLKTSKETK